MISKETLPALEKKMKKMEDLQYSKKQIQMILMSEELYSKI